MMRPEVDAAVLHMCVYGMTSTDEFGKGLAKKPTRMISSSPEVLRRVEAWCSNEFGGHQHRHVNVVQGRAKAAQVYPRELGMKICEGIAAQRKFDSLGLVWRPSMSVDQMQTAAKNANAGDCPSESLHEEGGQGFTEWDDISGQQLEPQFMVAARKEEIKYFREIGV